MSLARFSGDESQVRKSFLNTSSLRPQSGLLNHSLIHPITYLPIYSLANSLTNFYLEFETIKIVILREKYIKKLSKALKKLHDTDDNIGNFLLT